MTSQRERGQIPGGSNRGPHSNSARMERPEFDIRRMLGRVIDGSVQSNSSSQTSRVPLHIAPVSSLEMETEVHVVSSDSEGASDPNESDGEDEEITEGSEEEETDAEGDVEAVAVTSAAVEGSSTTSNATSSVETTSSQHDFRTPKKVDVAASTSTTAKAVSPGQADDEDECCPICFEHWTTSGAHRLVSLRCGHLFGQSCIMKWLSGQGEKCPHCNKKAKKSDIRVIYAKVVKAVDTTEKDYAIQAFEKEKIARQKAELDAAQSRLKYQLAVDECNKLRMELERRQQQVESLSSSLPSTSQITSHDLQKDQATPNGSQYLLDRTLEISKDGGCRVVAFSQHLGAVLISQPSANPLFPGYGVKKLSTMDFRSSQFICVHSKPIRDLSFNAKSCDGLLLSCSMDKTVKITSVLSNTVVQSYETPGAAWSCAWDGENCHLIYAGLMNGTVRVFDTRNTGAFLEQLNTEGSNAPVVALQYVEKDLDADFRPSGILVGQLQRTSFHETKAGAHHQVHFLPLEGSLTSLTFEPTTRHILGTFRPSGKIPNVRHLVSKLISTRDGVDPAVANNVCTSQPIQTLHGGSTMKMLSRSQLFPHPDENDKLLVCAGDDASSSTKVWDVSAGRLKQKLSSSGPVVDTCHFSVNNNDFLTTLTEKSLSIYKWT